MQYAEGPDVSEHNGLKTDFAMARQYGQDFAFVRLGRGVLPDGAAPENVKRARANGFPVLGYWYDYPRYGLAQVDVCVQTIEGLGGTEIIKAIGWDVEEEQFGLPVAEYRQEVFDALGRLEMAYWTEYVKVYTSAYKWGKTVGGNVPGAERFGLWTAHWTLRMPPYAPYCPSQWGGHDGNWEFWQYLVTKVPWHASGLKLIDLNRANMTDQEFLEKYGDGGGGSAVPAKLIYPRGKIKFTIEET